MSDVQEKPYTGLTACIKIGSGVDAKVLAYVSGVDMTLEKSIIEILAFGMQFKEKVPAIKDWSASINGTVALAKDGTQEELYNAFDSGDPITLGIYLDDNTYFSGVGYVSSFNISASPDDKISLTSEIAGSGATTLTLAESATKVATPTASPAAGAVVSGTTVSLSCSTAGAVIHYTTDGSTPTSSSTTYSTPISITEAKTIKAIAVKQGLNDSDVLTVAYTISA